jgi:hypothetical protein
MEHQDPREPEVRQDTQSPEKRAYEPPRVESVRLTQEAAEALT